MVGFLLGPEEKLGYRTWGRIEAMLELYSPFKLADRRNKLFLAAQEPLAKRLCSPESPGSSCLNFRLSDVWKFLVVPRKQVLLYVLVASTFSW